ncbi:F-box/FBD/LRR-repeat protein At1g13570-like [Silene latifolia]|uniref:F-box/FBD/LRR-repeat protein At1g13570-like n=1 Tax=Silene latifolia TaxID=37657 RepID=UPI003D76FEAC
MASTSKRAKTVDVPLDLFAEVPRHVIDVIVDRLPLRTAARLSVLSSKWLDIWKSRQTLEFDVGFFSWVLQDLRDTEEYSCLVSKILFKHSGHLFRFHLEIPSLNSRPDVDQWICYLSRTGVSDISIDNDYRNPLILNRHIFSCGNLEKLKLHYFIINFDPPGNCMCFKKMTHLDLDETTLTEKAFKYLIRSCPLLQELRLTDFIGMEHISIDAPHLTHLIVDGTFISLDVRNAEKLVSADFGLHRYVDFSHKTSLGVLIQTLASSHKLQKLVFRGHFVQVLYKEKLLPSTFENLRWLELKSIHLNKADEFDSIISIIQACPAVERLNISVSTSKRKTWSDEFEYNPSAVLHRLCYADVDICRGSNKELKLIEFLLECSPILKKLSLTTSAKDIRGVFRPETTSQLIHFRRASPNLEISCPDLPSSYHYCSGYSDHSISSADSYYMSESD